MTRIPIADPPFARAVLGLRRVFSRLSQWKVPPAIALVDPAIGFMLTQALYVAAEFEPSTPGATETDRGAK